MISLQENKTLPLVILVDDSSIDNFVNNKIIKRYEFATEVIAFTKAREALGYLIKINNDETELVPSILFLDLDMPEIDGFEFLSAFDLLSERIKKNISIVILTSSINPADVEKCKKHESVLTFLHKPLVKHNLEKIDLALTKKIDTLVKCQDLIC
jgi:CheY-like chemotaxis protein